MAATLDFQKTLDDYSRTFEKDHQPCKKVSYNCAVRLSLAMHAGGFTISGYKEPKRVHNSEKNHIHEWDRVATDASTVPHLVAAEDLFARSKRVHFLAL